MLNAQKQDTPSSLHYSSEPNITYLECHQNAIQYYPRRPFLTANNYFCYCFILKQRIIQGKTLQNSLPVIDIISPYMQLNQHQYSIRYLEDHIALPTLLHNKPLPG